MHGRFWSTTSSSTHDRLFKVMARRCSVLDSCRLWCDWPAGCRAAQSSVMWLAGSLPCSTVSLYVYFLGFVFVWYTSQTVDFCAGCRQWQTGNVCVDGTSSMAWAVLMLLCASHWHANQTQCARVNSFTHIQQFSGRSYLVQEVVRQMSLAVLIAVSPACGELPMCDVEEYPTE